MPSVGDAVLTNAVLVSILAPVVAVVTRVVNRPAVACWLWALLLLKLLCPPIVEFPISVRPASSPPEADRDAEHVLLSAVRPDCGSRSPRSRSVKHPDRAPAVTRGDPARPGDPVEVDPDTRRLKSDAAVNPPSAGPMRPFQSGSVGRTSEHQRQIPAWVVPSAISVWLAGGLGWFLLVIWRVRSFARLIRRAEPASQAVQLEAHRLADRLGLRSCPEVRIADGRFPPLLWALAGRATILLPARLLHDLTTRQQSTLLAHELVHYRRGDHLFRWVEILCLGIYWWHPVAWWVRRKLHAAQEESCDAWVLSVFPSDGQSYSRALLKTVDFLSAVRVAAPPSASGFGQTQFLKRRFEMILYGKPHKSLSLLTRGAVLTVAAGVLLLFPALAQTKSEARSRPAAGPENASRKPAGSDFQPAQTNRESLPADAPADNTATNRRAKSPDGKTQAEINADGFLGTSTIQIIDAATGKRRAVINTGKRLKSVAFSADGKRLWTVGVNGKFIVWDAATGKRLQTPGPVQAGDTASVLTVKGPGGKAWVIEIDWKTKQARLSPELDRRVRTARSSELRSTGNKRAIAVATAEFDIAQATLEVAKARLNEGSVRVEQDARQMAGLKRLARSGAVPAAHHDKAAAALAQSRASLLTLKAEVRVAEAGVELARAKLEAVRGGR